MAYLCCCLQLLYLDWDLPHYKYIGRKKEAITNGRMLAAKTDEYDTTPSISICDLITTIWLQTTHSVFHIHCYLSFNY
jgi:hypothetical protein